MSDQPRHAWALRSMLLKIPEGDSYDASRYDTDDEYVLKVFDGAGHSYDIRLPKRPADGMTYIPFSSLEKLLLAIDDRLLKDGSDDRLRQGIGNALKVENDRILSELDEAMPFRRQRPRPGAGATVRSKE